MCGAVAGAALLEATLLLERHGPALEMGILGVVFGGVVGASIGLVAGFVMTFLVGRHLPRREAGERAFLVAFIAAGLPVIPLFALFFAFHPGAILAGFGCSSAAGTLSSWLATRSSFRETAY